MFCYFDVVLCCTSNFASFYFFSLKNYFLLFFKHPILQLDGRISRFIFYLNFLSIIKFLRYHLQGHLLVHFFQRSCTCITLWRFSLDSFTQLCKLVRANISFCGKVSIRSKVHVVEHCWWGEFGLQLRH